MKNFYQAFIIGKLDKASSLQYAMKTTAEKWSHPYRLATFTLKLYQTGNCSPIAVGSQDHNVNWDMALTNSTDNLECLNSWFHDVEM